MLPIIFHKIAICSKGLLIIFVLFVSGLALVVLFYFQDSAKSTIGAGCAEDMSTITDLEVAVRIGDGYFGGGKHYNIFCANLAYTRALTLDQNRSPMVWYQLGRINFIQGKFEVAIYRFEKMMELFGVDAIPNVHYMLGLTYGYRAHKNGSLEDWLEAEREFSEFNRLDPESPWSRVDLAWVLFSQGKYEEMKLPLAEALSLHPDNPWVLNMYGLAQLNTGDATAAAQSFTQALSALESVTPQEWGRTYPGNDPARWGKGLEEMKVLLRKNLELSQGN